MPISVVDIYQIPILIVIVTVNNKLYNMYYVDRVRTWIFIDELDLQQDTILMTVFRWVYNIYSSKLFIFLLWYLIVVICSYIFYNEHYQIIKNIRT